MNSDNTALTLVPGSGPVKVLEMVPESETLTLTPDHNSNITEILEIPLSQIRLYRAQPRTYFNPIKLRELADAIREVGQSNPGKVRPLDSPDGEYRYELISGERRFRACQLAGRPFFRAEIDRSPMTPAQQFLKAVACNADQEPLSSCENALVIQRFKAMGLKDPEIAKVMSQSVAWVTRHYSLLKLSAPVFAMMGPEIAEESRLSSSAGQLLLQTSGDQQLEIAKEIVQRKLTMVQIRHLIARTLNFGGTKKKGVRPYREFIKLSGFIDRTHEQLQIFLDTPGPVMRMMLADAANLQERMRVIEVLDDIALSMPELRIDVEAVLALAGADKIRERAAMITKVRSLAESFPKLKAKIEQVLRDRENTK